MKKILLGIVAVFLSAGIAWGGTLGGGKFQRENIGITAHPTSGAFTALNGTTNKTAIMFKASSTLPFTAINLCEYMTVNLSGSYINLSIWSYNSTTTYPDTMLGTPTPQFACRATSGYSGEQILGTDTGAVNINDLYFVVIQQENGTPFNSTYRFQPYYLSLADKGESKICFYNNTKWGFISSISYPGVMSVKHTDGNYSNMKLTSGVVHSGNPNIYGTNVQGIKFVPSCNITSYGMGAYFRKTGSPNTLTCQVYNGSVSEMSVDIPAYAIQGYGDNLIYFPAPFKFIYNTTYYILLNQTGTSDSNDYDIDGNLVNASYYSYMSPQGFDFVYGNISNGTALLSVENDWVPVFYIMAENITDMTYTPGEGGGGTTVIRPSKSGFVK